MRLWFMLDWDLRGKLSQEASCNREGKAEMVLNRNKVGTGKGMVGKRKSQHIFWKFFSVKEWRATHPVVVNSIT